MQQAVQRPSTRSRYLPIAAATAFMAAGTVPFLFRKPFEEKPRANTATVNFCQADGTCKEKKFPLVEGNGKLSVGDELIVGKTRVVLLRYDERSADMLVEFPNMDQTITTASVTAVLGKGFVALNHSSFPTDIAARKFPNGEKEEIEISVWTPDLNGI